jgi:hydroxypyruvate isomerase
MTTRLPVPIVMGGASLACSPPARTPIVRRRPGKLKQAICPGVLGGRMSLSDKCREVARLGLYGIDLVGPKGWPTLRNYGLIPTMSLGGMTIHDGINRVGNHAGIERRLRNLIRLCAASNVPNVIALAGDRNGQPIEKGIANCIAFLNRMKPELEDNGVTLCIEYLNSKVDHLGYDFDHMSYGVQICRQVNSPHVKILYDMYHAQIMEGDIIRTIRDNFRYIGHLHTAGNPGRHEMDDMQEMNYRGIATQLVAMGYTGFVSHEYVPLRDPLRSLEETARIFDVA